MRPAINRNWLSGSLNISEKATVLSARVPNNITQVDKCLNSHAALRQVEGRRGARFRPLILELADIAPDPDITARVRKVAPGVPGVLGLDKCFVRKKGFNFYVEPEPPRPEVYNAKYTFVLDI